MTVGANAVLTYKPAVDDTGLFFFGSGSVNGDGSGGTAYIAFFVGIWREIWILLDSVGINSNDQANNIQVSASGFEESTVAFDEFLLTGAAGTSWAGSRFYPRAAILGRTSAGNGSVRIDFVPNTNLKLYSAYIRGRVLFQAPSPGNLFLG